MQEENRFCFSLSAEKRSLVNTFCHVLDVLGYDNTRASASFTGQLLRTIKNMLIEPCDWQEFINHRLPSSLNEEKVFCLINLKEFLEQYGPDYMDEIQSLSLELLLNLCHPVVPDKARLGILLKTQYILNNKEQSFSEIDALSLERFNSIANTFYKLKLASYGFLREDGVLDWDLVDQVLTFQQQELGKQEFYLWFL